MKLTLKQAWRPRPLNSFLGFIDIKLGVTLAVFFALLNKVAGVYGLIAVFTGGSFAQLSMYIYSVATFVAFGYALKAITEEDARSTLYFAHLFFADHILSTMWTVFFGVVWWAYTPHDGRRQANSAAQEQLMKGGSAPTMTDEERTAAALRIWNKEKDLAAVVIVLGWLAKIYFAILIYSYAIHLRKGSYCSLPLSKASAQYSPLASTRRAHSFIPDSVLGDHDEEDELGADEFYRMTTTGSDARSAAKGSRHHGPRNASITSFSEFVSAPNHGFRKARGAGGWRPASAVGNSINAGAGVGAASGKLSNGDVNFVEEVLFDSDELRGGATSQMSTDDPTSRSVSSADEDANSHVRRFA